MTIDRNILALQIAERLRDLGTKQGRIPFRTGDLRKSIYADLQGTGRAVVGSNLNYARAVHDGRPAITIRPKRGKVLRWPGPNGWMFATEVHQPARKGQPFLAEAAQEMSGSGYAFLMPELQRQGVTELEKWMPEKIFLKI